MLGIAGPAGRSGAKVGYLYIYIIYDLLEWKITSRVFDGRKKYFIQGSRGRKGTFGRIGTNGDPVRICVSAVHICRVFH